MHAWPQEIIRESDDVIFEDGERFTVVAVHEDKCWITDSRGREEIVPIASCIRVLSIH